MMDVEAAVIAYLTENLDCTAYAEVPSERPERFVTVERTGGGSIFHGGVDRPTVAVQSWETSRAKASALAVEVDALMARIADSVENVMGCELNSLTNFPDPDSEQSRYQGLYELVTN